jgi:mono/diheme cytochrome c family protein
VIQLLQLPPIILAAEDIILAAEEAEEAASAPSSFGIGAIILTLTVTAVLAWMAYLFVNSRRRRSATREEAPYNLQPYMSDDELENKKTTRVLQGALLMAILLAVLFPWYAFNEPDRQADAAEFFVEEDLHFGERWYNQFLCIDCHGPAGGGGAAAFVEDRSGVDVNWNTPSLNDIFYRYSEDEVRFWIVYGRAGTPMPAAGLEGGGAMTVQEVDQVIAYIRSLQIPQEEALAKSEPSTAAALARIANGDDTVQALIDREEGRRAEILAAPEKLDVVGDFPDEVKDLFTQDGTCTEASAALLDQTCDDPGEDADRDGLSDVSEPTLTEVADVARVTLTTLNLTTLTDDEKAAYRVSFDPLNAFTNQTPDGTPIPDLVEAEALLQELENDILLLTVVDEQQAAFLAEVDAGLEFLETSAELQTWDVDYVATQEVMNDLGAEGDAGPVTVTLGEAEQAVGLYNAYCARCHTGGWSAGSPFEVGAGSGAWGPALWDNRSLVQFPDWHDQVDFVVDGSQQAVQYGVNGIGSGRMPGFGQVLSERQIELIVLYERTL